MFKKWIFFIIIGLVISLVSSCATSKEQRRASRASKKLEKLKDKYSDVWDTVAFKYVEIDTVIKEIKVTGETKVKFDTVYIDSIIHLIDTVRNITHSRTEITKQIIKYLPRLINIDTLTIDTLDIHLKVYYNADRSSLYYNLKKDSSRISKKEKVKTIQPYLYKVIEKIPWWVYILIGLFLIFILNFLRRVLSNV